MSYLKSNEGLVKLHKKGIEKSGLPCRIDNIGFCVGIYSFFAFGGDPWPSFLEALPLDVSLLFPTLFLSSSPPMRPASTGWMV